MSSKSAKGKEICCPKFNPEQWDGKILDWKNKKFVKDKVFTLVYICGSRFQDFGKEFAMIINSYYSNCSL